MTSQHEVLEKSRELEACFILPTSFPMLSKNWTFCSDVWTVTANWLRRKMKYSTENSLILSLSLLSSWAISTTILLLFHIYEFICNCFLAAWFQTSNNDGQSESPYFWFWKAEPISTNWFPDYNNDKVLIKMNTKMDQIMWFYIMSSTSFFIIANKVIIALTWFDLTIHAKSDDLAHYILPMYFKCKWLMNSLLSQNNKHLFV